MVEKKTKAEQGPKEPEQPAEALPGSEQEAAAAQEQVNRWEFINRTPSPVEVGELLATLPEWWGVRPRDFADYVQALPSNKKISVQVPTQSGGTRKEERRFDVVTLYFSVAGRQQMLREAQERHGWRVDFVPEPTTKTGTPGFLQMDERLVYREYVDIWVPLLPSGLQAVQTAVQLARETGRNLVDDPNPVPEEILANLPHQTDLILAHPSDIRIMTRWIAGQEFALLGRKPGMAWVPESGGSQAKGTNPYEKVETAARGRALAAWGFGVLPGSGVASYEEMMGVPQAREALVGEAAARQASGGRRETSEELQAQILVAAEEARQIRGEADGWNLATVRDYVKQVANRDVASAVDQDGTVLEVDLSQVPPAALLLIRNKFRDRVAKLRDDAEHGS